MSSRHGPRDSRLFARDSRLLTYVSIGLVAGLAAFVAQQSRAEGTPPPNVQKPLNVPVSPLFPNGGAPPPPPAQVKQYEGNPTYIAAGHAIFDHYNCSGCHFHGAGGMGPAFYNDGHFIYGGRLDQIYASIYQGRPNGMPSWAQIIPQQEIWEIAAYVKALSEPSQQSAAGSPLPLPTPAISGGNVENGAALITKNGCGSCHQIPGIHNATGTVGPPLTHIAGRAVIAGVMPNTPDNMMAWISNPQAIVPGNAMPNLGLKDNDVRDIATYLYTLR